MIIGRGSEKGSLAETEVWEITKQALDEVHFKDKKVLVLIPDLTRNAPIPLLFKLIFEKIGDRVENLDYLIASGTHQPMSQEQFYQRVGVTDGEFERRYGKVRFFNHACDNPDALIRLGIISADEIHEISDGVMREEVQITLNKLVFDYDFLIILSPVVPHEVVGFSGGNKYLFPGIAGADFIHFFHWLAAVITNVVINGTKTNPVRKILDRAASLLQIPRVCFCVVMDDGKLRGLFIGNVEEAWSRAADLSAKLHIRTKEKPFFRVLGIAPEYYDELWVAGKVMYKLEPIVADGGELIIYAPHIHEISYTYGMLLRRIGYHVRDYFLKQMEKFSEVPRGVMAHSTHVKGIGKYEGCVEKPRINVTLATGISEAVCRSVNLGYREYQTIDVDQWKGREKEGILVVEKAGEVLFRLREPFWRNR